MSIYNSQYQDYYRGIKRKGNKNSYKSKQGFLNKKASVNSNYFVKRIIRDLAGTLILFLIVIGCKLIVTPQTKSFYDYSKQIVNKDYDYKALYSKVVGFDLYKFQDKIVDYIEEIKCKFTGEKTLKETVKESFIMPLEGKITSKYGYREDPFTKTKKFHEGIDIGVKENTDVKSISDGKIKDCGEDRELGKYILVDHGKGVESKYAHLNKLDIKKGEKIKKGQVIGKSGNTGKSTGAHLHFEFIYMGESKNPCEFLEIE